MDRPSIESVSVIRFALATALCISIATMAAGDGILRMSIRDETNQQPVVSRIVVRPVGKDRPVHLRGCQPAGIGVLMDREVDISLRDGGYRFRLVRGPEYRMIDGTFALEKNSDDSKSVALPRMVDMFAEGWVAGDALAEVDRGDLPLSMAGEDLHVALAARNRDRKRKRSPRRPDDPLLFEPVWIDKTVATADGVAVYGLPAEVPLAASTTQAIVDAKTHEGTMVAVTDPFDLAMPVWLASGKVDGVFVMGDWLRLNHRTANNDVSPLPNLGRRPGYEPNRQLIGSDDWGRWAEFIYHQMLEVGFELPPIAGGGLQTGPTPLGYNRVYVHGVDSPVTSLVDWQRGLWSGHSVCTNGPMLRCRMNDEWPGHRFTIETPTRFQIELDLAVRDPVEYLDVIHNGKVFYSAALDEFAKTGGRLPPLNTDQPGWVVVRVVTGYPGHYRFAMTAPWYIHVGGRRRVSPVAVKFWRQWLTRYERHLLADASRMETEAKFIAPARQFWNQLADQADDQRSGKSIR